MRRTAVPAPAAEAPVAAAIDDLVLQDQSGETFTYRDFFHGRASVVTFFYTRCMKTVDRQPTRGRAAHP